VTFLHASTYILLLQGGREQQWLITLDLCCYILCYVRNKFCEQLPDVHMINRNRKYWFVNAAYSTRCHTVHTTVVHVFVHSEPWSLFTAAIVKQNIFT